MVKAKPDDFFSAQGRRMKASAIEGIHRLLEAPGMRSLAGAWPDPALFPAEEIADITIKILQDEAAQALQYGSTRGNPELRRALAEDAAERQGLSCSPEQILVTSGSAQGLDLACRVFIDPGDLVLIGLPSYFGATGTIASYGARYAGIAVDEEGIAVEEMENQLAALTQKGEQVKAVYVIPNFQNPTGVTLSLARRHKLLELAERYRFMIFEDDPYGELRFEGEPLPSLMALDETGCVIYLRSMSKTFSPGMRIAWAAAQSSVIDKMELAKQFSDISTNSLTQLVLLEMIRTGALGRAVERNIAYYRIKRDLMLELMTRHFPEQISWTRPTGGFFTFVTLPETIDGDDLLTEALKHKVAFVSGSAFFVEGSGRNSFRLSYSQASAQDIRAAIPILGQLIDDRLAG
jgi:2-aminoadipate transaminase